LEGEIEASAFESLLPTSSGQAKLNFIFGQKIFADLILSNSCCRKKGRSAGGPKRLRGSLAKKNRGGLGPATQGKALGFSVAHGSGDQIKGPPTKEFAWEKEYKPTEFQMPSGSFRIQPRGSSRKKKKIPHQLFSQKPQGERFWRAKPWAAKPPKRAIAGGPLHWAFFQAWGKYPARGGFVACLIRKRLDPSFTFRST